MTDSWKMGGPDGGKFDFDATDGQLTFKAAPNFEAPGDADKDNVYEVTVSVADDTGNRGSKGVKVTVTDANEVGKVTLSKIQPRVGIAVKASLSDPDGNLSKVTWEWWSATEDCRRRNPSPKRRRHRVHGYRYTNRRCLSRHLCTGYG